MISWQRSLWWTLFLSYAGLIFWFSNSPIPEGVPFRDLPGADRGYHIIEYGVLAFLGLQACAPQTRRRLLSVLFFCWLYGLTDELHQAWVPGRSIDLMDWLADGVGVAIVGWAWARWRQLSF